MQFVYTVPGHIARVSSYKNKEKSTYKYVSGNEWILGAFAKLRKATISFVVSVCPSVRMEQLVSHWKDIREIWYLSIFRKLSRKLKFH